MSSKRPWNTALSSLVITLCDEEELAAATIREVGAHPAITTGETSGSYLPALIERADARRIHEWLESLPGVRYVDVVFCSTEASQEPPTSPIMPC